TSHSGVTCPRPVPVRVPLQLRGVAPASCRPEARAGRPRDSRRDGAATTCPQCYWLDGLAGLASPSPGGAGMVISIGVTGPRIDSGLSNSVSLPTTSTAILFL